jgi:hypothetical protein
MKVTEAPSQTTIDGSLASQLGFYNTRFGDRLRENSLSEALRDRFYDNEVEKLNPTCSVIGFLLETMPVCPIVRKLMDCAWPVGWGGGDNWRRLTDALLHSHVDSLKSTTPK